MTTLNAALSRLMSLLITIAVVCGNNPSSAIADDSNPNSTATIPKHFILNPDTGRPTDYPVEISITELEAFLKKQRRGAQACGEMTWEGESCGAFCDLHDARNTPWLKMPVALKACYAQTKTGTFLASFTLGRNKYSRVDRNKTKMIWTSNYDPEYQRGETHRILYGDDSGKRKELLTKIKHSFQDLDLAQFPAKSRELLKRQVLQCENDTDPDVVNLARQIRSALTLVETRP